jgi:hypothetical protein
VTWRNAYFSQYAHYGYVHGVAPTTDDYNLAADCSVKCEPQGCLCDMNPTDQLISIKENELSDATWFKWEVTAHRDDRATGVLVIDLSEVKTFNQANVFQVLSDANYENGEDGKTPHFRISAIDRPGDKAPDWTNREWTTLTGLTRIGWGTYGGDPAGVLDPTVISFDKTSVFEGAATGLVEGL